MKKKNIAIMIDKMHGGGAERVASKLSTYLSAEKYNKKVITFDSEEAGYSFEGEIIDLQSKVSNNPFGKLLNFLKRAFQIRKIKKQEKIDVTISLLSGPNLLNILTGKNNRVIISVRNFISKSSTGIYGRIHKALIKMFYNKADFIVAVSEAIKNDLISNFGIREEKIRVIYNFYDIDKIKSLSDESINDNEKNIFNSSTVITVGSLTKQKGHWHLIRAFKIVKEQIPDSNLVILGQGKLENYLSTLTKELGLENDVHFIGFQKNPFKYLSQSGVYAFPSLYEGFPNALSEAMACGMAVLSTDCKSGPREIFNFVNHNSSEVKNVTFTDYGVLVPVCDGIMYDANESLKDEEIMLAEGIIKLMSDNNVEKYGNLSKDRVRDFHIDKIIPQWDSIINM